MSTNRSPREQPWEGDPFDWPTYGAQRAVISADIGYSHDFSCVSVVVAWFYQGQTMLSVPEIVQLPLNSDTQEILAVITKLNNKWAIGSSTPQVVVDSRSAHGTFEQIVRHGFVHTPVGISARSGEMHSQTPARRVIKMPDRKSKGALVYSLSRNQLIDDLNSLFIQRRIFVTQKGEGSVILKKELASLERHVTEARNVRFVTPSGSHDDAVVSTAMGCWGALTLPMPRERAQLSGPKREAPSWLGYS